MALTSAQSVTRWGRTPGGLEVEWEAGTGVAWGMRGPLFQEVDCLGSRGIRQHERLWVKGEGI